MKTRRREEKVSKEGARGKGLGKGLGRQQDRSGRGRNVRRDECRASNSRAQIRDDGITWNETDHDGTQACTYVKVSRGEGSRGEGTRNRFSRSRCT